MEVAQVLIIGVRWTIMAGAWWSGHGEGIGAGVVVAVWLMNQIECSNPLYMPPKTIWLAMLSE